MLRRFLSAAGTAAALIAIPALVMLTIRPLPPERALVPLTLWCFAPAIWGLWAMAAPARWAPRRLPLWGAMLGVIAAVLGILVLDMPSRVLGIPLTSGMRVLSGLLLIAFYYLAWHLVRLAYESLAPATVPLHEARDLLDALRLHAASHPELEDAVKRLEVALANLTVRTSGML